MKFPVSGTQGGRRGLKMRQLAALLTATCLSVSTAYANTLIPKIDLGSIDPEAARTVQQLESAFVAIRMSQEPEKTESLRENAARLACQLLSHDNSWIRGSALGVLEQNADTVELSGIGGCFDSSSMGPIEVQIFARVLDRSKLFFLEEAEKRAVLRRCLREGSYELWHGWKITANYCIGTAAWDGVQGLWENMESAHQITLGKSNLSELLDVYTFFEGPGTGWEPRNQAARRIIESCDAALGQRLHEDEGFRTIVLGFLNLHCTCGKKTTCDELRSRIKSAVLLVSSDEGGTPSEKINWWWRCALYEKGTFTPMINPSDQVTEEMIEEAMKRQSCDEWSSYRYPREFENAPSN